MKKGVFKGKIDAGLFSDEYLAILEGRLSAFIQKTFSTDREAFILVLEEIEKEIKRIFPSIQKEIFSEDLKIKIRQINANDLSTAWNLVTEAIIKALRDESLMKNYLESKGVRFINNFDHPDLKIAEQAYKALPQVLNNFFRDFNLNIPEEINLLSPSKIFYILGEGGDFFEKIQNGQREQQKIIGFFDPRYYNIILRFNQPAVEKAEKETFSNDPSFQHFAAFKKIEVLLHELIHQLSFKRFILINIKIVFNLNGLRFNSPKGIFFKELNEAITQLITLLILRSLLSLNEFQDISEFYEANIWDIQRSLPELSELIEFIGSPYIVLTKKEGGRYQSKVFTVGYVNELKLIFRFVKKIKERCLSQLYSPKLKEILEFEPHEENLLKLILRIFFQAYFEGKISKLKELVSFAFPGSNIKELNDFKGFVEKYCK